MFPFKIELDRDIRFGELNEMRQWLDEQSGPGLFQCTMHWYGIGGSLRSYIVPLPCARKNPLLRPRKLIDYPVQSIQYEFASANTALHFKCRWDCPKD